MEKGNFGKIRNAAKEWAGHIARQEGVDKPEAQHVQAAFYFFRELRTLDEQMLDSTIETLSKIKEERARVGEERYRLFEIVSTEKEYEYREANSDKFINLLEDVPDLSDEERDIMILDHISSLLDATEKEIKNDPRMQDAFRGEGDLLNEMVTGQKTMMKIFFQGMLSLSRKKESLH